MIIALPISYYYTLHKPETTNVYVYNILYYIRISYCCSARGRCRCHTDSRAMPTKIIIRSYSFERSIFNS